MPLTASQAVPVAGGLLLAQRGAVRDDPVPTWSVVGTQPIARPATAPDEAHNVDGDLWRRTWSSAARFVVEFLGVALVEVDTGSGEIAFDRDLPADLEQHLLLDHVLPLLLAHRGQVVLHGAVVGLGTAAVVLVGSSGAGKSTLATYLWQHGWWLGGDDGAVLVPGATTTAEPTYGTVRLTPGALDLLGISPDRASPVVGKLRLAPVTGASFTTGPAPLRVVALVEPAAPGADPRFTPLRGVQAHAELFGSTFHANLTSATGVARTVDVLAEVVDRVPVGRLAVPRGLDGLAATETVLRALAEGRTGQE